MKVDVDAFKALINAAVALNKSSRRSKHPPPDRSGLTDLIRPLVVDSTAPSTLSRRLSVMSLRVSIAALVATAFAHPGLASGQPATRPSVALTQAGAEAALQAAERLARQMNDPAAIAVVDTDGLLMAFVRMDEVRPGSVELAIGKARSAALMQRPTAELEANVASGRVGLATAGLTALGGGAPLKIGGSTVGAIGVAGTKKEDDVTNSAAVAAAFPGFAR